MTRRFIPRTVTVVGDTLFICDSCGAQSLGQAETRKFDDLDEISLHKPGPHYMPIGWGSYSGACRSDHLSFRCPTCIATNA